MKRFLSVNNTKAVDVLPSRRIASLEDCARCATPTTITTDLEAKLTFFVCAYCRYDSGVFENPAEAQDVE